MAHEFEFLPDIFRDAGLPIEVSKTFRGTGRPYAMDPWGSIWHHTASGLKSTRQTNINVVTQGNGLAPGPIAHVLSCRESPRLYLVADGYCNNAGKGWWPAGQDSGNKRAFAVEWVNNGVGEPAHPESVEVTARAFAEVHKYMGWDLDRLWTHAAYAPTRKIDPKAPALHTNGVFRTWTLADVRGLVAPFMNTGDDMFVPIDPIRHFDTRWNGFAALEPGLDYPIARHGAIPSNAKALALNITVTQPEQAGWAVVFDTDRPRPTTSKINFSAGQTIANGIIVKATGGDYTVFASARTHFIVDIDGYFV